MNEYTYRYSIEIDAEEDPQNHCRPGRRRTTREYRNESLQWTLAKALNHLHQGIAIPLGIYAPDGKMLYDSQQIQSMRGEANRVGRQSRENVDHRAGEAGARVAAAESAG